VVSVTGCTLGAHSRNGAVVTAWLSGGAVGVNAVATCEVTTAAGRIEERRIVLRIVQR
jgi:hypothetical protein